jgi:hypothetical protein
MSISKSYKNNCGCDNYLKQDRKYLKSKLTKSVKSSGYYRYIIFDMSLALSLGGTQLEHEADYSAPSSATVMNERSQAYTPQYTYAAFTCEQFTSTFYITLVW